MYRYAFACLILVAAAGCSDLTTVPAPPVSLSVLEGEPHAAVDDNWVPTAGRPAIQLVRAAPPRALALLHLPDIAGGAERFQRTGLYRWLNSRELKRELGPSVELLKGSFSAGGAPVDVQKLLKSMQGEAFVCLEEVRVGPKGPPEVRVLAGLTVDGAEDDIEKLLALVDAMASQSKGIKVEKGNIAGTDFSRIVGRVPTPFVVELALHGNAVLLGYGRETVTGAIQRLDSAEATSLIDTNGFQETWKRCGDPRDAVRLHLNIGVALEQFGRHLPSEARDVLRSLALDKVRSVGAAIRFEGADITVATQMDSPGGKDFFTELLAAHPVDRQLLEHIPGNASAFSLFAIDGKRVVSMLRRALPADSKRSFENSLAELRNYGFDLEKDVFDVFGPRCAIVNVPIDRVGQDDTLDAIWSQLLGTVAVFEVQDPKAAAKLLAKLPRETAFGERRSLTVAGVSAIAYRMDSPELPSEFAITCALHDGYFIVSTSEEALRRMLKGSSPTTVDRFRKLIEDVPTSAVVLSYENVGDSPGLFLDTIFDQMTSFMPSESRHERGAFRRTARLQDFGHAIAYTVADERGIYSHAKSPTGGLGSTGGLSGLFMLTSIVVPNLQATRLRANQESAAAVVETIYSAQETFRSNAFRDQDGDGEGEFGLLSDLLGQRRRGESGVTAARRLLSVPLRPMENGDYVHSGYYFRVYLPAEDGSPVGSHEDALRIGLIDSDLAETMMVIVAWPVEDGATGRRAFYMSADGKLYACEDGYSGRKAPPADLRCSQAGNLASEPLRPGRPTRDGKRWHRK